MTDQRDQELPRATPRRLIIGAVLRGLVATIVLVVLYYLLPLDRPWDTGTAVRLLIGLPVFAGLAVWQVRAIAGSRYPGLRAAEALGLIIPLYLLLFASTYFLMERASAVNFTQPLTRTDALYFSVTVFGTVGFGDITAKSETARIVLIVQMLADLALLGAGAQVLLGAVHRGQQRKSGTGAGDGPGPGAAGAPDLPVLRRLRPRGRHPERRIWLPGGLAHDEVWLPWLTCDGREPWRPRPGERPARRDGWPGADHAGGPAGVSCDGQADRGRLQP